jgi:tetratricopeptide (TPR) repeat protein
MEIFIRLAGVQLGPYTEEQVQQHITDGLLSLSDTAKSEGTDWAPLRDVLTGSAPGETGGESKPAADAASQPVPGSAESADDNAEANRRAPAPPPGVMHLPTRAQDPEPVDSGTPTDTKRTGLIEPVAPVRSPFAPTSTSIATTSPLVPQNQPSRKTSRAALVKALASGTSPLPTRAINAPPRPPVASPEGENQAATKQLSKKPVAPPTFMDSLTAKTVPLRPPPLATPTPTTPPIPAPPSTIATTEPLASRRIMKPATGAVSPAAAARAAEAKAAAEKAKAGQAPVGQAPVGQATVGKTATGKASAEYVPIGKKSSPPPISPPPLPEVNEMEVATVKMKTPSLQEAELATLKKRRTSPLPEPPASALPPELAATKPPRAPTHWLPRIIGAWAVLAALAVYYIWSPYHAAASLRAALDSGDVNGLKDMVDFPSVRDSLKAQIASQGGTDVVTNMLNQSVDTYFTAEGIAALINKSDTPAGAQVIAPTAAAKILLTLNAQPGNSQGLASVSDFVVDRGAALLHLRFNGLIWKLKQVQIRPDLAAAVLMPVVDTYLGEGETKAKNNDAKGAIDNFSQVIKIDPQSAEAYNNRGAVRESTGDTEGAIKDYTQALKINPQMAVAFNGRGNAKAAKNDLDGAIADFDQAIHLDPNLANAFDSRGNAKSAKNDIDGAIADFTEAIRIDPTLATAYSDRGFARQANGNPDGAIADYTAALALKPKTARTYFNRGLARQQQGNLDAAIVDFDRALAFDPKIAEAYYFRANAKSANHDIDGAISDYTQAVALDPKNASAYSNRGLARQGKGDIDGAAADYTQALNLDPKITAAYYNRAVIEAQKNDSDGAIADSTQALYLDPKNAQAYGTRGFAKLTKGNLDGAQADLKQFCDLAPRDHNADHARLYLWLIAKAQNSGMQADQDLSAAMESSWNSGPDDVTTKTANYFLGRMSEPDYLAAATSPDAKTDQAQHCSTWYFTGMKRMLMGDKRGAIEAFRQCVATGQKDFVEYVLAQNELQALVPVVPLTAPAPAPAPPAAPKPPKAD